MVVLGLDTSTNTASVALIEDGKLLTEDVRRGKTKGQEPTALIPRANHAETLLPLVEKVLKNSSRSWAQISALAVAIGPGSFTGLRIGLSTVKGLAYGWDVPVIGVPTLLAVVTCVTGWNGLICPLLDARKKEVYTALFRAKGGHGVERLTEDLVCSPHHIFKHIQSLGGEACLMIGDGTEVYEGLIKEFFGETAPVTQGDSYPSIACSVASIAEQRLRKGDLDSPDSLVPRYLRPSEAELKLVSHKG